MNEPRDYGRLVAMAFMVIVAPIVLGMTLYWTIAGAFPGITAGGWILVCAYAMVSAIAPAVLSPIVSNAFDMGRYAWRLIALVWISTTAIAGLIAWPVLEPYIKPLFVG